jgi:hypothetical protein
MTSRPVGRSGDGIWIAGWAAAAFVLRAVLAGFTNRITGDGVGWYMPMARAFVQGRWREGFDAFIPPVYSLFTAAVAHCLPGPVWKGPAGEAGALEIAGQIVSVLFGAAVIPLDYLLPRRLAPPSRARGTARAATALAAVSPWLVRYGSRVMTESVYTFFFVVAILAGLALLARRSAPTAAAFGLAVGVACLNRPEAMLLLAVFGAWIGIPALVRRRGVARALGLGVVVGIFFLAGAFPQMAITRVKTGVWTLSAKGGVNFLSAHTKDPLARESWLYPAPAPKPEGGTNTKQGKSHAPRPLGFVGYVLSHPTGFTRDYFSTLGRFLVHVPIALGVVLTGLGIAGIALRRGAPLTPGERVAASIPLAYLLALSAFRAETRFLVPLVPVCLLWPAMGVLEVGRWLREGGSARIAARLPEGARRRPEVWVLGAALLLTLPEAFSPAHADGWSWYWSPEKRAGVWMRRHLPPHPKVMTRGSYIEAYYAGARVAYFPFAPYDDVLRYVRRNKVGYVLLDETKTRRLRADFFNRVGTSSDMRLVRKFDMRNDTVMLYEVLPPRSPTAPSGSSSSQERGRRFGNRSIDRDR